VPKSVSNTSGERAIPSSDQQSRLTKTQMRDNMSFKRVGSGGSESEYEFPAVDSVRRVRR
jgi:hypothetical protein